MTTHVLYVCILCGDSCITESQACQSHYPTKNGKPRTCFACSTIIDQEQDYLDPSNVPVIAGSRDYHLAVGVDLPCYSNVDLLAALTNPPIEEDEE